MNNKYRAADRLVALMSLNVEYQDYSVPNLVHVKNRSLTASVLRIKRKSLDITSEVFLAPPSKGAGGIELLVDSYNETFKTMKDYEVSFYEIVQET